MEEVSSSECALKVMTFDMPTGFLDLPPDVMALVAKRMANVPWLMLAEREDSESLMSAASSTLVHQKFMKFLYQRLGIGE
ncbi:hypothetical protein H6P81_017064 [Aristolochia fimbriata]|uniref:F-box domain-containing protein n=1 Tax=Aristolochia fimbriata TaxID=158543 RepID=A0AAV7DX46_ARIFI|nr:hypothetical protein H6P81_017064 [Aristolochia fimbriata]